MQDKQKLLEKDQLLEEVADIIIKKEKFGIQYLATTYLIMAMVIVTLFPKVYLQTQIYYKSRDISTLKQEYKLLKEENKIITRKVETMKFQNQILDTLF